MGGDAADPLLLGQRVVAILETGLRTATYKLATLMALIDHCIENLPPQSGDHAAGADPRSGAPGVGDLLATIAAFDGHELRQSTQPRARILLAAKRLRGAGRRYRISVDLAMLRAPAAYESAIDEITFASRSSHCIGCRGCPAARGRCPSLRRLVSCTTKCRGRLCGPWRRHRTETRCRAWACAPCRTAQAGAGDHVGRRCATDEQVP